VSCTKMPELIEMSLQLLGSRNHVLDFRERTRHSALSCTNMAEPIDMVFGLSTRLGRNGSMRYVGVHIGVTWRIRLNHLCAATMWPFCQITLNTCLTLTYVGSRIGEQCPVSLR